MVGQPEEERWSARRVSAGYSARLHQRPSRSTDGDGNVETGRDECRGDDVLQGSGGHEPPLANESGMREAARYLLAMVGNQHHGGAPRIGGQRAEPGHQSFPCAQVEAGRRFVEE